MYVASVHPTLTSLQSLVHIKMLPSLGLCSLVASFLKHLQQGCLNHKGLFPRGHLTLGIMPNPTQSLFSL